MQINKDIQNTIRIIERDANVPGYKKVKIFPDFTLKHFKKYKLDGKDVLSKINSIDEIFDLATYNANITCFSDNPIDEYFLNLLTKAHKLKRNTYFDFVFKDNDNNRKVLSKTTYDRIKDELDDRTRDYFDEVFSYCIRHKLPISRLIEGQKYPKEVIEMYVRHYLNNRYGNVKTDKTFTYWRLKDEDVPSTFKDGCFDFINISREINESPKEDLLILEKEYARLLKEYGKMQSFVSRNPIEIEKHKRIESRSLLDPYSPDNENHECKKDYAYMYINSQQ